MFFKLKRPCKNCPFLKEGGVPLAKGRLDGIVQELVEKDMDFTCHKTIDYKSQMVETTDGDEEFVKDYERNQHCAGALIFLEKMDRPNQAMRLGERLGLYNRFELEGHELVIEPENMKVKK
ncbi:hypothetical protein [Niallia taxi]|uniref:hypothetical protein n=1 Tax=Niallia taxi TaxID=2499688 RepID=UPI0015F424FA|nr:hypothetical protein [Niallia taxi]